MMSNRVSSPLKNPLLWFAALAAPVAWTIQIPTATYFGEVLCYEGAADARLLGIPQPVFLVGLTATLATIAALAGVTAYVLRQKYRREAGGAGAGAASWMALAGLINSAMFLPAILVGLAPPYMLGVCQFSP